MSERPPIDEYLKAAFNAGLANLAAAEEKIVAHPLQAELKAHQELRAESPTPYQYEDEETKVKKELDAATEIFRTEVERIKQDLERQLGIARNEATKINDQMVSKKLALEALSQIKEIEEKTSREMEGLSGRAGGFGRDVLDIARKAKNAIDSDKNRLPPDTIEEVLRGVKGLHSQFVGLVLSQDRYGRGAGVS